MYDTVLRERTQGGGGGQRVLRLEESCGNGGFKTGIKIASARSLCDARMSCGMEIAYGVVLASHMRYWHSVWCVTCVLA
eukprot:1291643-Rhodomonas_salina.2